MNNKLWKKLIRFPVGAAIAGALIAGGLCAERLYTLKRAEKTDEKGKTNPLYERTFNKQIPYIIIMVFMFALGAICKITATESEKSCNQIRRMTKNYYADYAKWRYPELQYVEHVLDDKKNLNTLANFICNSLSDAEIDKILVLVNQLNEISDSKDFASKAHKIENDISEIIAQHAAKDNYFGEKLISLVMSMANATYATTRKSAAKKQKTR